MGCNTLRKLDDTTRYLSQNWRVSGGPETALEDDAKVQFENTDFDMTCRGARNLRSWMVSCAFGVSFEP